MTVLKLCRMDVRINHNIFTEFKYISTFVKGKKPKLPQDYRFLFKSIKKDHLILAWLIPDIHSPTDSLEFLDDTDFKIINKTHFKHKSYNYYYHEIDKQKVHDMLLRWLDSNPMVHIGGYVHQHISDIPNYTSTYIFDNIGY